MNFKLLLKNKFLLILICLFFILVIIILLFKYSNEKTKTNSNENSSTTISIQSEISSSLSSVNENKSSAIDLNPPAIEGATAVNISNLLAEGYIIDSVKDIDANRILIFAQKKSDSIYKLFIYNISDKNISSIKIFENTTNLFPYNLYNLEDGKYFLNFNDNKGILLNNDLTVNKEIIFPKEDNANNFVISPNGLSFAFLNKLGVCIPT